MILYVRYNSLIYIGDSKSLWFEYRCASEILDEIKKVFKSQTEDLAILLTGYRSSPALALGMTAGFSLENYMLENRLAKLVTLLDCMHKHYLVYYLRR